MTQVDRDAGKARKAFGKAIIIGGSIAGSLAAAALAEAFDEVVVLDRDAFPEAPAQRKEVPQGAHFHALLGAGQRAMDALLPGFSERAYSLGAAKLDATNDVMRLDKVGWSPRFESSLVFLMASRPLIEWTLREQARALPNVVFVEGTEVTGLTGADGAVTGVHVKGESEPRRADFVVDASGRRAVTPEWLESLGFPAPQETKVNAHWGYSSTFLRVPNDWNPGFRALAAVPYGEGALTPESARRAMAMWVVEGDRRWILTVQGSAGDHPPRTEADLREFVSQIGVKELDDALDQVEFPERIAMWRDTTSRLRDFGAEHNRPENLVVVGDAWGAFNPVYGQGMTVAALDALTLREQIDAHLRAGNATLSGLAARYYDAADTTVKFCFQTSSSLDYRIPGVEVTVDGEPREPEPAGSSDFADRLAVYMGQDQDRYIKYRETTQLLRSPEWMQSDEIVSAIRENWDELGAQITPR